MLTFTPVAGASGTGYASFTFKVNDGTVFSDSAYTMTIDVTDAAACAAPDFGTRRNFWTGTVTVGTHTLNSLTDHGYTTDAGASGAKGSLDDDAFTIGANSYTIQRVVVHGDGSAEGDMTFEIQTGASLTTGELAALRLHVCDVPYDFSAATRQTNAHDWAGDLDWSSAISRTLYLSLPANNVATEAPAISGTATVGQVLTATTGTIADADGLPTSFTYQWLRVDADGTSNEADITGEIAATYTLADDDGKKIKVKLSFTDDLNGEEERTSGAYPTSGTVQASSTPVSAVLVSNVGKSVESAEGLATNDLAQSFTTGANADGYTLTSIELKLSVSAFGSNATPTVTLYSGSATGTEVSTLTGPAMLEVGDKNYTFTPSPTVNSSYVNHLLGRGRGHDGCELVKYWRSTSEDGTSAMGWLIGDSYETRPASSTGGFTVQTANLQLTFRSASTALLSAPPPTPRLARPPG